MDHILRDLTNISQTHALPAVVQQPVVVQQPAIVQPQAALVHASDDYLQYMSEIEVRHSSP